MKQRAINWLNQLLKWLGAELRLLERASRPANGQNKSPAGGAPAPAAGKPKLRIPPHKVGIWVQCASCGVVHELEAICHRCGAPLCRDTQHCRLSRYDSALARSVIYCPNCAGK
jgi:hypothetical protein